MKTIQVFDPALCCSAGVCGVEVDQALVSFSADVAWAQGQGAKIERFNLAQRPMAFAENAAVKGALERSGEAALPLIVVEGVSYFPAAAPRAKNWRSGSGSRPRSGRPAEGWPASP